MNWYREHIRRSHISARDEAILDKLEKGPVFKDTIKYPIPREDLANIVSKNITPTEEPIAYPIIVGEYETGKTSLIKLALKGLKEPKGGV